MDQRALIDVVCKAGLQKLAGEISALLGQVLSCSDIELRIFSKQKLFSNPAREKSILTRMTISGDREGNCYLMNRISSAAILGGTLIMLPLDMIEENTKAGKLEGELGDAFGEVANIIAGVMTQAFVDKYPKNLRFIKKTIEELIPTKIVVDSDDPFPPGDYYIASCAMAMEETDLGTFEFIVPAALFDLAESAPAAAQETTTEVIAQNQSSPPVKEPPPLQEQQQEPAPAVPKPGVPNTPGEPTLKKPKFIDAKKLVDVVFKTTVGQIAEEVGALLGQTLKCNDIQLLMTSKAEFFSNHCLEKSILTDLNVTGDKTGLGYLLTQVPDAIALGGTLIMLPDDQITEQMQAALFEGEVADAFGEIANILAGSLTQTFLDRYPKPLRFVKTDTRTIVPTKIDIASDQPFEENSYYLASFAISMEGYELHRFLLIFPAELFDLDASPTETGQDSVAMASTATPAVATGDERGSTARGASEWGSGPEAATTPTEQQQQGGAPAPASAPAGTPIVLVLSDQQSAAVPFVEILSSAAYDCRVLSFQDEIRELFQQHQILGIFLVMAQVGEKGFAAAIKLQAAGRPLPPLIFAGEQWTRSAVLRAVKYGARDILVTPASGGEIQDKVLQHFKKAS